MSEQQEIDDFRRVEAFLADAAVRSALEGAKDRFYLEFKAAKTEDERTNAWAKANALDTLADELVRRMENGKVALIQREQREERERQIAARKPTGRK
jgi:hypothetical protein